MKFEKDKWKHKQTNSFTIAIERIKYLGINKGCEKLYTGNYKALFKKI